MKIDLEDIIRRAWVAGFYASTEGFNAERPFAFDEARIARETDEDQKDAIEIILRDVKVTT